MSKPNRKRPHDEVNDNFDHENNDDDDNNGDNKTSKNNQVKKKPNKKPKSVSKVQSNNDIDHNVDNDPSSSSSSSFTSSSSSKTLSKTPPKTKKKIVKDSQKKIHDEDNDNFDRENDNNNTSNNDSFKSKMKKTSKKHKTVSKVKAKRKDQKKCDEDTGGASDPSSSSSLSISSSSSSSKIPSKKKKQIVKHSQRKNQSSENTSRTRVRPQLQFEYSADEWKKLTPEIRLRSNLFYKRWNKRESDHVMNLCQIHQTHKANKQKLAQLRMSIDLLQQHINDTENKVDRMEQWYMDGEPQRLIPLIDIKKQDELHYSKTSLKTKLLDKMKQTSEAQRHFTYRQVLVKRRLDGSQCRRLANQFQDFMKEQTSSTTLPIASSSSSSSTPLAPSLSSSSWASFFDSPSPSSSRSHTSTAYSTPSTCVLQSRSKLCSTTSRDILSVIASWLFLNEQCILSVTCKQLIHLPFASMLSTMKHFMSVVPYYQKNPKLLSGYEVMKKMENKMGRRRGDQYHNDLEEVDEKQEEKIVLAPKTNHMNDDASNPHNLGVPFVPDFLFDTVKIRVQHIISILPSVVRRHIFQTNSNLSRSYTNQYELDINRSISNFADLRKICKSTLKEKRIELDRVITEGAKRFNDEHHLLIHRRFPLCFTHKASSWMGGMAQLTPRMEESETAYMRQFIAILNHLRGVWKAILTKHDQVCTRAFQFPHQHPTVQVFQSKMKQDPNLVGVKLQFKAVSILDGFGSFRTWLREMGLWNVFSERSMTYQSVAVS